MTSRPPHEDSARVLAMAVAAWAIVIAAAAAEGAFAHFSAATLATFAALVSLYGVATYFLDRSLHEFAASIRVRHAIVVTAMLVTALAAALSSSCAPLAVFLAPLAAVSAVATSRQWVRRRRAPRSTAEKSPGARPAAT